MHFLLKRIVGNIGSCNRLILLLHRDEGRISREGCEK